MTGNPSSDGLEREFSRYGPLIDDWGAFLEAARRPLPTCVWAREGRIAPDALAARLQRAGFEPRAVRWRAGAFRLSGGAGIGKRWEFLAGLCHVQEEASLLPVRLLDPRPGHRVLDLCAAPGGKTAEMALAIGNRGTVVANEVHLGRIRGLRSTLDRLGVINVSITRHDGSGLPTAIGAFDRILVDAPCSGSGTVRRRTTRLVVRPTSPRLAAVQEALLRRAVRLCRPGGRVVYSTCTFPPEENEAVVDRVLRRDGERYDLHVLPAAPRGLATSPGVVEWEGATFDARLRHAIRLWPHHQDTGGFFAVLIEKRRDDRPLEDGSVPLEDLPGEIWDPLVARYGLEAEIASRVVVHHRTARGLHAAAADHRPPVAPAPETIGFRLTSAGSAVPRLTTTAAQILAPSATRNVVELSEAQCEPFLTRADLTVRSGGGDGMDGSGPVLVRHEGFGLGCGLLREGGRLESLVSKNWGGRRG